jgi:hypothetical protein
MYVCTTFFMMSIFLFMIMPSQLGLRMKQKGVFWLALWTLNESSILMLNGSLMESFRFLKHHEYLMVIHDKFWCHQPWFSLHCKCWACLIHLLMHVNALLLHQDLMHLIFFNILKFVCVWTLKIMVTPMLQLSTEVWVLHITNFLCWFDKSEVSSVNWILLQMTHIFHDDD